MTDAEIRDFGPPPPPWGRSWEMGITSRPDGVPFFHVASNYYDGYLWCMRIGPLYLCWDEGQGSPPDAVRRMWRFYVGRDLDNGRVAVGYQP